MARKRVRAAAAAPVAAVSYAGPERRRFVNRSWPLPAFAAWGAAWLVFVGTLQLGAPAAAAFIAAGLFGAVLSLLGATPWRRLFIGCGFPLSFAVSGSAGSVPAWLWLLPLGLLALVYPWRTWRDAPLFPTPRGALEGLAEGVPLPEGARVLDAGCGLGAGLIELHRAYPQAVLEGTEWSALLRLACAWRCPWASVRRGDLWADDWSGCAMVYLFQRPESMARAAVKARGELQPDAWLASLEFEVPGMRPDQTLDAAGRTLWLYRAPFIPR